MNTLKTDRGLKKSNNKVFNTTEVVLPGIVEPSGLLISKRTLNSPSAGQVVVKVEASGISFAEQSMRRGRYYDQPKFPFTPGYDLVGTVVDVGSNVDSSLIGKRVAALTKIGGWASYVLINVNDLLNVPDDIAPDEAETMIVNGITAWQMLHRKAKIQSGQTILVHGANGGVGTILVQLAQHAGVRVIGTSSTRHHDALRAQGVEPLDYNDPDLAKSVRKLAPQGVDAVFDHLGGESVYTSYSLLNSTGKLICYAIASALNDTGSFMKPFMLLLGQLTWWNIIPNGHKSFFYNIWAGHKINNKKFQKNLQEDFSELLKLLASGIIKPKIAASFTLEEITSAMELAESRTVYGKIIITP
ncbi:NADPH:quinone reductase [bacterium]|nr:MAG: NADPH:quinone reductase [bacterium]